MPDGDEKLDNLLSLCRNLHENDFALGLEYCEACITLSDKLERTSHKAWAHVYKAQAHEVLGDYKTMALNYHEAIELFAKIKDTAGLARTYNQLGYVELKLSDEERAMNYFKLALSMAHYVPIDNKRAELYAGVGTLFLELNSPDSAIGYLRKGMTFIEERPDSYTKARIKLAIGQYHLQKQNFNSAFNYFKQSLQMTRRLGSVRRTIPILRQLGELYIIKGVETKALHFLTEALELSLQIGNKSEIAECYQSLARCHEHFEDVKKALFYYKMTESMEDSIFNEDRFKSMALVQARFEFNNKMREVEISQEETLVEERMIRYFWIAIALLTLGLSIASAFAYRTKVKTNEALREQNAEKDILIKEVHHRVKNNLQLITSLLNLQRDKVEDPETKKALTESSNRVKSMAMVHHKLYQEADVSKVNFEDYLNELIEYLATGLQPFDVKVKYNLFCDEISFNLQTAIPLGLIINEVITNSLKYAFSNKEEGNITIRASKEPEHIFIIITDDGVGLPQELDPSKSNTLGMHLIRLLAKQIKAEIMVRTGRGTKFEIKIKPDE